MQELQINILLVESRTPHAKLIKSLLLASKKIFHVYWVTTLDEASTYLKEKKIDVVIADIMLGDGGGHQVIQQLMVQNTTVPIIMMMDETNVALGKEILSHGAQDFLGFNDVSIDVLVKSIYYSIERERLTEHLKGLSMTDDLTSLYNRRGFRNLAEQQMRISERTKRMCSILFIDLDNLKAINDTNGHLVGDKAIMETADILRDVLRNTDIIGRLGGDEFIVMAPDTSESHIKSVIKRLRDKFDRRNKKDTSYTLSASIGTMGYTGTNPKTLEDLQDEACKRMYEEKQGKKQAR